MKSNDIHIRAISQEMPQSSITKICLKIIFLKFHSNFPGANELNKISFKSARGQWVNWLAYGRGTCLALVQALACCRVAPRHHLARVPLMVFRPNSKFHKNLECSGLKYDQLITTKFCTRPDSYTVMTCTKYRCDWLNMLWTRTLQNFIEFQSKYH